MTDAPAKRPRGRPPRRSEALSTTLNFRVRPALHQALRAAAAAGEYSISEEIERRLEKSFTEARILDAIARIEAKLDAANVPPAMLRPPPGPMDSAAMHRARFWDHRLDPAPDGETMSQHLAQRVLRETTEDDGA